MCGICGIVNFKKEEPIDPEVLTEMRDVMTHRGPDDEGLYINQNAGLGFRRLSIVDISSGHQPMCNENGNIWIIFNGEIYNHSLIRKELLSKGHIYKTRSDTESIIHLYEEEGIEGFKKMNGMFGIAIWDDKQKQLILVRDRLGIKPLYYCHSRGSLIFASEIKSILKSQKVRVEMNAAGLEEYLLFRFVAGEKTLFEGIYNLLPGHILILKDGRIEIKKFWDLPPLEPSVEIGEKEAVDQLDELLNDSVKLRLMSDVALGTLCSGGVDSSLISAYAVKLSNRYLNTFSVGFQEAAFDESRYARIVSEKYKTRHHQLIVDNKSFADSLPALIWHNDEPLNHPNSVQIYHISRMAKEFVTVVLTGEGADELFAGYPRYLMAGMYLQSAWLPMALRRTFKSLFQLVPIARVNKLGRFLPLSMSEIAIFNATSANRLLVKEILDFKNGDSFMRSRLALISDAKLERKNLLESIIRLDLKTYLLSILNRQDKMSMAACIESRVPFLDYRLVEWGTRIPMRLKIKGFQTKAIVKKLGKRKLPTEIIYRRKSGFGVPLAEWLLDPGGLGRFLNLFAEQRFKQRGFLKHDVLLRLVAEHLSGKADHSEILWGLINLELWYRIYVEGDPV